MPSLSRAKAPLPCGANNGEPPPGTWELTVTPRKDVGHHQNTYVAAEAKAKGERNPFGVLMMVKEPAHSATA